MLEEQKGRLCGSTVEIYGVGVSCHRAEDIYLEFQTLNLEAQRHRLHAVDVGEGFFLGVKEAVLRVAGYPSTTDPGGLPRGAYSDRLQCHAFHGCVLVYYSLIAEASFGCYPGNVLTQTNSTSYSFKYYTANLLHSPEGLKACSFSLQTFVILMSISF